MTETRKPKTIHELAEDAADCIEINKLKGQELLEYLTAWIAECAVKGDLAAIAAEYESASERFEETLERGQQHDAR